MTINIEQVNAIKAWFALRTDPKFISVTPDDRYEARLSLADDLQQKGLIDSGEWREMVEEAQAAYADELG